MKKKITVLLTCLFALVITLKAQVPTVTFTATPTPICAGNSITFTNTNTGNPTQWIWYFPGGTPAYDTVTTAPGDPIPITYSYGGTFFVSCVVVNGSGRDSVTNYVVVHPQPTATISPPSGGICAAGFGDSIYFSATPTTGNTYSWAPAGGLSCTNCPNPRAAPSASVMYTITVTGTNSCTTTYYDSVTVGNIIAEINGKIMGNDTLCSGDSLVLLASGGASNSGSNTYYRWNTGATGTSLVVNPTSNTSYTCIVTSGTSGCSAFATVNVIVLAKPHYTITGPVSTCYPGCTTLTLTSTGGNNYEYKWAGPFGTKDTNIYTTCPNVTTVYTLTASNMGCHAKDSLITIEVTQPPHIIFTGASNLCQGSSTIISASGGTGYHWSTGATTSSINVAPFATVTYTVQVSKGACIKDTSFTIVVDTLPFVKFKGDTSICRDSSTTIYITGGNSYLWNTGSIADSITGTFTATTVYYVTVTKGACSKDSSKLTIKVYPHPKPALYPVDTTVCQYDTVQLVAAGGNYYTWLPKKSGLSHYLAYGDTDFNNAAPIVPGPTRYNVNVCTWGCCQDTSIIVNVIPGVANYSVCCNQTVAGGTPVSLTASYSPGPYEVESWSPTSGLSCSTCNNPTATVYTNITYTVTFLDQGTGCPVTDSVTIDIFNCNVFVPDVFSPGESVNNKLYVRSLCLQKMDFGIYDRLGNKVFETSNQEAGWDGNYNGKPMNIGTYVWFLKGIKYDGTNVTQTGNVTLVR